MKELIKECFVNYEKWNKFLSLHELNKEELNDKVYLQKSIWKLYGKSKLIN